MTQRIVINSMYGGFGISASALTRYATRTGRKFEDYENGRDIPRDDPVLVQIVEEGDADGPNAELKIVDVPDDVVWRIEEYDGVEWVAEVHRTWS